MVIGERAEDYIQTLKRHIDETQESLDGWKNEYECAAKSRDEKHKAFCEKMIIIWKNTLEKLNKAINEYE